LRTGHLRGRLLLLALARDALLEDRLRSHPLVSQVVVVGDQRPFIGALITLDAEMLPGWLHTHSQPNMTVDEAANSDFVLDHLQKAVDRANRPVSRAESIRKFTVLPTDFTEANGYLTPSMKIKRALITKDFAADIDALYSNDDRAKVEPKD
jgi:long-chain acyl-CoA synthetase